MTKRTESRNCQRLADYGDLLSVSDLAKLFLTSKGTVYKELHNGKFGEPIKIGRKFLVPKELIRRKLFGA